MPSEPTKLPEWATGGSAEILEPPSAKKALGWVNSEPAPQNTFNWWWNLVYQWIAYFKSTTKIHATLDGLIDELADGETGILDESDRDSTMGSVHSSDASMGAAIACDGRHVIWCDTTPAYAATRDFGTLDAVTYTPSPSFSAVVVVTNGAYVVTTNGLIIACFNATTGAQLWQYTHGAAVADLAIDGTQVYLCGTGVAGTFYSVRALDLAAGTVAWSYAHSGTATEQLHAIATNGRAVFVAGDASTLASGATLRALNAANGNDFSGEGGGTSTDTSGVAWDAVQSTEQTSRRTLACDHARLFLGYPAAAANEFEVRSAITGGVINSLALVNDVDCVAVDHEYAYVLAGGSLYALDKRDLAVAWIYVAGGTPDQVVSDGAAVFLSDSTTVKRLIRGNRTRLWQRVSGTDVSLPYRWLAIPTE